MGILEEATAMAAGGQISLEAAEYFLAYTALNETFLMVKEIDRELFPPSVRGFFRQLTGHKAPFEQLGLKLEKLAARAREATMIVQTANEKLEGTGQPVAADRQIDLQFGAAVTNCCNALYAFCNSMVTGAHAEHRTKYIAAYREFHDIVIRTTVRGIDLRASGRTDLPS
jgi:hypothetical protein